jgi:putative transposase
MAYFHFVARAHWPFTPFSDHESCAEIWERLRQRFPKVIACILMPNHLHLLVETKRPRDVRRGLSIEMSAFTRRRHPGKNLWQPIPMPEPIPDRHHLKRQIRYVHLNPCRKGLASDPLEWEWSTHRDYVGAVQSPWADLSLASEAWGLRGARFVQRFHGYISADPSVRVEGTPAPYAPYDEPAIAPLSCVVRSTRLAMRLIPGRLGTSGRKVAVHLAHRLGRPRAEELAAALGISRSWVFGLAAQKLSQDEEAALEAARRVLADPRLLNPKGPRVDPKSIFAPLA